MILFLDDDKRRTRTFRSNVPQAECAATAPDMISLLKKHGKAALLFLDHDLGGETFVDSDREDCGMEVVRWIVKNRPQIDQIIVHTCNGPASDRMYASLTEAGYETVKIPFIVLPWEEISKAAASIYGSA